MNDTASSNNIANPSDAEGSTSLRARVYWWLERPDRSAKGPKILEIALIGLITLNAVALILETVQSIYDRWDTPLVWFERFSLAVFLVEYLARLWVVPENPGGR